MGSLHIVCAPRLSFVQGFAARFTAVRADSDVEERRLVGPPALTRKEIERHGEHRDSDVSLRSELDV
jgi:hypothetical protein